MNSMALDDPPRKVIVGVDTHKHIHVAVAIDHHGARLGDLLVSADSGGYVQLELGSSSRPHRPVWHRGNRELWGRAHQLSAPLWSPHHRGQPGRQADTPAERQVRHCRRRGGRSLGAGGDSNCCSEDR